MEVRDRHPRRGPAARGGATLQVLEVGNFSEQRPGRFRRAPSRHLKPHERPAAELRPAASPRPGEHRPQRPAVAPHEGEPFGPRSSPNGEPLYILLRVLRLSRIASAANTTRQETACRRGPRRRRSPRQYGAATATTSLTCPAGWSLAVDAKCPQQTQRRRHGRAGRGRRRRVKDGVRVSARLPGGAALLHRRAPAVDVEAMLVDGCPPPGQRETRSARVPPPAARVDRT